MDFFLCALDMPEAEVQKFFADFLRLAESGDICAAADYLAYPVVVEAAGEAIRADTPEELLPYWNAIFTTVLWERINIFRYDRERSDMWVDGVGVMAAGGAIRMERLNKELKITTVYVENGRGIWKTEQSFPDTDWNALERVTTITRAEAETFLYGFMHNLRSGDLSVAEKLAYPCILTTPEGAVTLHNPEDLYGYYNSTFGMDAKTLVMSIGSGGLFGHDGLAAAGDGMVWFGSFPFEGLKIVTVQGLENWHIRPVSSGVTAPVE